MFLFLYYVFVFSHALSINSQFMKRTILVITILLGIQCLSAQKTEWNFPSQQCKDAVDSLLKYNYLDYYGMDGWNSTPTRCILATELLAKNASETFLDTLARAYPNPAIRATAGRILISWKSPLAVPLVFDLLHDTGEIDVAYFDVIEFNSVANFLVDELFDAHIISEKDSLRLNDSLLYIQNLNHIKRRANLLEKLPAEPQYYELVKRMYVEEHDGQALITLARFQHDEDTVYILENLLKERDPKIKQHYLYQKVDLGQCALLAVANWPHPSFQRYLIDIRNSFFEPKLNYNMPKSRYFFSAVMAYRSQWSLDLIEETFQLIKQNPDDRLTDYYNNEGWYSHNYGESFDRAYELDPTNYDDDFFDALHQKYGRENHMGW